MTKLERWKKGVLRFYLAILQAGLGRYPTAYWRNP